MEERRIRYFVNNIAIRMYLFVFIYFLIKNHFN